MPSRLAPPEVDLVRQAARAAARALGVEHGWAHVEIKLHDGVATVIEIAARNGGGYTRDMIRLAYGIDMRRILIDSYLGDTPRQPAVETNTVVGRIVVASGLTLAFRTRDGRPPEPGCFQEASQRLKGWMPRLFLGPPYSYDNTIMSYFVFHPCRDRALELFRDREAATPVRQLSGWTESSLVHTALVAALRLRGWLQRGRGAPVPEVVP